MFASTSSRGAGHSPPVAAASRPASSAVYSHASPCDFEARRRIASRRSARAELASILSALLPLLVATHVLGRGGTIGVLCLVFGSILERPVSNFLRLARGVAS